LDQELVFTAFLASIALSAGLILILLQSRFAEWSLDRANHRSLHDRPTPRVGGCAILAAVGIATLVLQPAGIPITVLLSTAILALLSVIDDKSNLPILLRLAVHAAAAIFVAIVLVTPEHLPASVALLCALAAIIIAVCWMTNLFNFMDGANGMAGGMAFFGFGGYAIAAALSPAHGAGIATIAASISGAALGFLFFNFPVARAFLGDAGSIPLGFLAIVLGIQGYLQGIWPWWFGMLIFSIFILDATITLLKRLFRGEKIWVAHREHYYQRLILSGWSHQKTVTSYYFLMLGSTLSALVAQNGNLLYPIAGFWVITYASLLMYLEWRFTQDEKRQDRKTLGDK
jgi:UDP-N-acetylmuramyl pentapeptide phosphotransferase/UDP-N-acetylglucosamine-1-phosphate transferase